MNKILLTNSFIFGILCSSGVFSAELTGNFQWDSVKSMTPALQHTINVSERNIKEELVGKEGPSPSNQALVIILTQQDPFVLMCKDYDLRKLSEGELRPTYGTLKASFGFGLSKDNTFQNSFEALTKGPANIALYKLFDNINLNSIKTANHVYSEAGQEWGPAVTIPLFLTGNNSIKMEFNEAEHIVTTLNQAANLAHTKKSADDIMTGRFRDFKLIPLKSLLQTGSDQPVVMDQNKLEVIEVEGERLTLWDESQMRKNLLPYVNAIITKFYESL